MTDRAAHRKRQRNWVEVSAAVCAVAISGASLFIALRQNALMEKQISASTWPVLEFGSSNLDDQNNPEISFEIRNAGLGPAKVRSFQVSYDGKPVTNSRQLLEQCCTDGNKLAKIDLVTSGVNHAIITANERIHFLRLRPTPEIQPIWQKLNTERMKVRVQACYCSALDECWRMDSANEEQERTSTCKASADDYKE